MKKWRIGWACAGLGWVLAMEAAGGVFISQYYEGTLSNKWIEIYNPGPATVDLTSGNYRLGYYVNAAREAWKTNGTPGSTIVLRGTIAPGGVFLLKNNNAILPAYATADQAHGSLNYNGDDSVVLYTGTIYAFTSVVDAMGLTGNTAANRSFVRANTVTTGTNTDFNAADWQEYTLDEVEAAAAETKARLGYHSTGSDGFGVTVDKVAGFVVTQGVGSAVTALGRYGTEPYGYMWSSTLAETGYETNANVFAILPTAPTGSFSATVVAEDAAAQFATNAVAFEVVPSPMKYAIAIGPTTNGTATTMPAGEAGAGATVVICATPDAGYRAANLAVVDGTSNAVLLAGSTFVMPASAVTVTAGFEVHATPDAILDFEDYLGSYASNDYVAAGVTWAMTNARVGDVAGQDRFLGTKSARLINHGSPGGPAIMCSSAFARPIDRVSFWYANYAADDECRFKVQFSRDGSSWQDMTWEFDPIANAPLEEAVIDSIPANMTYVRFITTHGASERVNIDDVEITLVEAVYGVTVDRADGFNMEEGTSLAITATAEYGTEPYAYAWTSTLAAAYWTTNDNVFTIRSNAPQGRYAAHVTATDASDPAQNETAEVRFAVVSPAVITLAPTTNGILETDPAGQAMPGAPVTVLARADPGYQVAEIAVEDVYGNPIGVTNGVFAMPPPGATVSAVFEACAMPDLHVDFENYLTGTYVPHAYAVAGVSFAMSNVLAGAISGDDRFNGSRSARFYHYPISGGGEWATMMQTVPFAEPMTEIRYRCANYKTDDGCRCCVQVSSDGNSWTNVGATCDPPVGTALVETVIRAIPDNMAYLRFVTDGLAARRLNIDDVRVSFGIDELGVVLDPADGFEVAAGGTAEIAAIALRGTPPYVYSWNSTLPEGAFAVTDNVFTILSNAPPGRHSATATATDSADPSHCASNVVDFVVPIPDGTIVVAPTEHGGVTTMPALSAAPGETVAVVATPDEGYQIGSISVLDGDGNRAAAWSEIFTMPTSGVNVVVRFEEIPPPGSYVVDFEGAHKPSLPSASVALGGLVWNMTGAQIQSNMATWKNGDQAANLAHWDGSWDNSSISMLEDWTNGLDVLSFKYCKIQIPGGTQVDWKAEYSTDGGTNWMQIGPGILAAASGPVQYFSARASVFGPVRIRIKRATAAWTGDFADIQIDDIVMTPYAGTGPQVSIGAITSDSGGGRYGFAVPEGYQLNRVQGADLALAGQNWQWSNLTEGVEYLLSNSTLTILTEPLSRQIIRIGVTAAP